MGVSDGDGSDGSGASSGSNADGGTANASLEGLPCEVAGVLSKYCLSCHGAMLAGGATVRLRDLEDLQAHSLTDAAQTLAERSVTRMRATTLPMPPAGSRVPSAEIDLFEAWVQDGMPQGTCSSASDPFAAAPTCTSRSYWMGGDKESPLMHPGSACIDCHTRGLGGERGPRFSVAGTVFATGHEPDDCNGAGSSARGAQVEITDARGRVLTLSVNAAGNFYLEETELALPILARVLYQGRSRAMLTPQTSGDCNGCHSQDGSDGAPGRIALP